LIPPHFRGSVQEEAIYREAIVPHLESAMDALLEQFTLKATKDAAGRTLPLIADLQTLVRFRSKMAGQGLVVNVAQMVFDRGYAFGCIALAHSTSDRGLQRLALRLFAKYSEAAALN
jgi:hypothetical protein